MVAVGGLWVWNWGEMTRIGSETCQARRILNTTPALFNQGSLSNNCIYSSWQFFFANSPLIFPRKKASSVSEMPTRPSLFRVPKADKQDTKWTSAGYSFHWPHILASSSTA